MALVTTKEMFKRAYEGHYSIGAFNVDNLETFQAVIAAADETKSPVIIAITDTNITFSFFPKNFFNLSFILSPILL